MSALKILKFRDPQMALGNVLGCRPTNVARTIAGLARPIDRDRHDTNGVMTLPGTTRVQEQTNDSDGRWGWKEKSRCKAARRLDQVRSC